MSVKRITKRSLADRKRGRTDFERLKNLTDKEIEAAIAGARPNGRRGEHRRARIRGRYSRG